MSNIFGSETLRLDHSRKVGFLAGCLGTCSRRITWGWGKIKKRDSTLCRTTLTGTVSCLEMRLFGNAKLLLPNADRLYVARGHLH